MAEGWLAAGEGTLTVGLWVGVDDGLVLGDVLGLVLGDVDVLGLALGLLFGEHVGDADGVAVRWPCGAAPDEGKGCVVLLSPEL